MSAETNRAIVRRMIQQVWNERRVDLIGEFFTEDYVGHKAASQSSSGLEELEAGIAMTLNVFPDLKLSIDDEITAGAKVVFRWTMRASHQGEVYGIPATGKQVTKVGVAVYRLVNARIAEFWNYPDNLGLMQQLGIITAGKYAAVPVVLNQEV